MIKNYIECLILDTATVNDVKGLVLYKACLEGKERSIHVTIFLFLPSLVKKIFNYFKLQNCLFSYNSIY